MNEVTKLYENAGIEPEKKCYYWDCPYSTGMPANDIPYAERNCQDCNNPDKAVYPPFIAEKQLELIKLLSKVTLADYFQFFFYEIKEEWVFRLFMITEMSCESAYTYESRNKDFTEALAGLVNDLWQDLTEEDKQQIKEILNG